MFFFLELVLKILFKMLYSDFAASRVLCQKADCKINAIMMKQISPYV